VAGGKFGESIPTGSFVEVERLVEQFNIMSRQLVEHVRRPAPQERATRARHGRRQRWNLGLGPAREQAVPLPALEDDAGLRRRRVAEHEDTWPSLAHPEDKSRVQEAFAPIWPVTARLLQIEHRLRHKDGSYRWLLMRGMALRDAAGSPTAWRGPTPTSPSLSARQGILHAQSRFLEGIAAGKELEERLASCCSIEEHWPGTRCVVWLVDDETRHLAAGG
jgi:hypothetical protein